MRKLVTILIMLLLVVTTLFSGPAHAINLDKGPGFGANTWKQMFGGDLVVLVPPDTRVVDFSIEDGNHHLHLMEKEGSSDMKPQFFLIQELSGMSFIKSGTFIVKETTDIDPVGASNDLAIQAALDEMKEFKPSENHQLGANTWKRTFGGDIEYRAIPGFKVVGFDLESENNHLHLMMRPFKKGETPSKTIIPEYSGMNRLKQGRFIVSESFQ